MRGMIHLKPPCVQFISTEGALTARPGCYSITGLLFWRILSLNSCRGRQFFCRQLLVPLFVLAVSHPILITAPIMTVQSPLEGINYLILSLMSNDTRLKYLGQIAHHSPLNLWHSVTLTCALPYT